MLWVVLNVFRSIDRFFRCRHRCISKFQNVLHVEKNKNSETNTVMYSTCQFLWIQTLLLDSTCKVLDQYIEFFHKIGNEQDIPTNSSRNVQDMPIILSTKSCMGPIQPILDQYTSLHSTYYKQIILRNAKTLPLDQYTTFHSIYYNQN